MSALSAPPEAARKEPSENADGARPRRRPPGRRPLRHRAELVLFRSAARAITLLPEAVARGAGVSATRLALALLPSRRRVLFANLSAAFPEKTSEEIASIARRSVESFAAALVDYLLADRMSREELLSRVSIVGAEHLRAARARGRGVFLLSAHFGSWEIAALVAGFLGEPIASVVRPLDNPLLEQELARRRSRFGNRTIAKKDAARDLLRAMRRNESVAILLDQNTRRHEAVFVPLFGRPAGTNPSLARLQLKTGAAVVPVFTWPEGKGRYRLQFEEPILPEEFAGAAEGEERAVRATARYMEVTEAAIRGAPEAWLWMHDRWHASARPRRDVPRGSGRASRLVVAPNWIGDAVLSLPFLRAIRRAHPDDRLVVLAPRGPASLYRAEGSADDVYTVAGWLTGLRAVRREKFREVWLLPNSFRSAILPLLARVPARIGYTTDGRRLLLTHRVEPPARTGHQLRDYDPLLRLRSIAPDEDPPRLSIPAEAAGRADSALVRARVPASERLVLLAPGAAFSWTKRWPAERFGRLASELLARGYVPAVAIGPGEEELARKVEAAAGRPLPILGADLDPVGLAALTARARLVVSNDSGPMHLAAAVGTPVVAIFGPTDPGRTGPVGVPCEVLDRYVFCSPCYLKECPYGHECMNEIEVEAVLRAVERVLAADRGKARPDP